MPHPRSASGRGPLTPEELARLRRQQAFNNPAPPAELDAELQSVQRGEIAPFAANPNTQAAFRNLPIEAQQAALRSFRESQLPNRIAPQTPEQQQERQDKFATAREDIEQFVAPRREARRQEDITKGREEFQQSGIEPSDEETARITGQRLRRTASEERSLRSKELSDTRREEAAARRGEFIGKDTATLVDLKRSRREAKRRGISLEQLASENLGKADARAAAQAEEDAKKQILDNATKESEARIKASDEAIANAIRDDLSANEQRIAENALAKIQTDAEAALLAAQTKALEATTAANKELAEAQLAALNAEAARQKLQFTIDNDLDVDRTQLIQDAYAVSPEVAAAANLSLNSQGEIKEFSDKFSFTLAAMKNFEDRFSRSLFTGRGVSFETRQNLLKQMNDIRTSILHIKDLPDGPIKTSLLKQAQAAILPWSHKKAGVGIGTETISLNNARFEIVKAVQEAVRGQINPSPPSTPQSANPLEDKQADNIKRLREERRALPPISGKQSVVKKIKPGQRTFKEKRAERAAKQ